MLSSFRNSFEPFGARASFALPVRQAVVERQKYHGVVKNKKGRPVGKHGRFGTGGDNAISGMA